MIWTRTTRTPHKRLKVLAVPFQVFWYNSSSDNYLVTVPSRVISRVEALCLLLGRFAYPGRIGDLQWLFRRRRSELSMTFNATVCLVHSAHSHTYVMSRSSITKTR